VSYLGEEMTQAKALSPLHLSLGFAALSGGMAIAGLADRAGPGAGVRMCGLGADKAEPGRLPGRARRGPGLHRRCRQPQDRHISAHTPAGLTPADFPMGMAR